MTFLSADEIADDLMLYKLTSSAMVSIRTQTLHDFQAVGSTDIGHQIRILYKMWDPLNPYTATTTEPTPRPCLDSESVQPVQSIDDDPTHPNGLTRLVLGIIWRRLR